MPYNTRRKSLSLPSLGIHVPMSNAARAAAIANRHSPSASSAASATHSLVSSASAAASPSSSNSSPTFSPRSPADCGPSSSSSSSSSSSKSHSESLHHTVDGPAHHGSGRKIKRSHASSHAATDGEHTGPASKRRQTDSNTPPPSPRRRTRAASVAMQEGHDEDAGVDLAAIDDEIVKAVIVQLQATRNRPHIVRDLAAVLMKELKIVQQSANPCAIISSRLSGYLKRSGWNAKNPCPLAKELETVHPRRTYFYLTTAPHQPLPEPVLSASKLRELPTPSATSVSEAEDDERRRELSPSPEVDLSAPEFDDMDDDIPMPGTPIGSFPGRHSVLALAAQVQRGAEPPLEKDEKEFTQTADGLQRRKLSGEFLTTKAEPAGAPTLGDAADEHAKDESLFGERSGAAAAQPAQHPSHALATAAAGGLLASPAIRPFYHVDMKKEEKAEAAWSSLDAYLDIRNPETVSLAELNEMLGDY